MKNKKSERALRRKLERDILKNKKIIQPSEETLYQLKYRLDEHKQEKILSSFNEEQLKKINGNPLPLNYKELGEFGHTYANNEFLKEIQWYTLIFMKYSEQLNEYLKKEDEIYSDILLSNFEAASSKINAIEENVCVSHWSIEQKLIISEYQSGFKKNKETLANIISDDNQFITNIFAKYQSVRIEKNLSFFAYEDIVHDYIDRHPEYLQDLLNFKLDFFLNKTYKNKGFILNSLNAYSIIDKYNAFILLVTMTIASHNHNDDEIIAIKKSLKNLSNHILDLRIKNLLISLDEYVEILLTEKNIKYLEILDSYTKANYDNTISLIESYLIKNACEFELYELYVKSTINLNYDFKNFFKEESFAFNCLNDLNNIIRKNEKYQDSMINSYKIFNSLGLNIWTYKYFQFFNLEHSISDADINIQKFSILFSNYFNPIACTFLENKSIFYLEAIEKKYADSATILLWKKISEKLFFDEESYIEFDKNYRQEFYQIKILRAQGKFFEAFNSYIDFEKREDYTFENSLPHNREELIHSKLICLLNLERFNEAINLIVETLLVNGNLKNKIFSNYLIDKIIEFDDSNIVSNISTSILLHHYPNIINNNDLWIAYDEFLTANELLYPKEFERIQTNFEKAKLIYFLKNICKQEIYDSSPAFESHDELDNERVEVCRLLSELDKDNFEVYINEIAEINRFQLIRKGIKQIDESKIYVDVKGIKSSLEKDIRESFDRSLNLLDLPIDQIMKIDGNADNILVPYYTNKNEFNKSDSSDLNIKITSYSRFNQFTDMFSKIRDKFISSNEFGIDTYLSMRIRHGTLLGEIRSVFEANNLITKKEDTSEKYQDNIFWLEKINFKTIENINIFNSLMSNFSHEIDQISNDLKNKKIQIKTEKKNSEGLFDYIFNENELLNYFSYRVADKTNYEDFFDTIIEILWERTEKSLYNIREHISTTIKPKISEILGELSKNIEKSIDKNDSSDLNEITASITSCQTDISNEFDKISNWFKRSNSKTINEFELNLPIDASLTILKRIFKDYAQLTPEILIDCPIKFEGENFPDFTYIMQNLFHNILKHSKLECKDLKIKIEAVLKDNILSIIVENNFSEKVNLEEVNSRINETKKHLDQTHDNDKAKIEDGTGYIKIRKTILTDLMRNNYSINVSNVDESRVFKSEIMFEINGLEKELIYENISY